MGSPAVGGFSTSRIVENQMKYMCMNTIWVELEVACRGPICSN